MRAGQGRGRVAVVAVHGVADQKPGDSARAVAELLLRLRRADGTGDAYGPTEESSIVMPTRRVPVDGSTPKDLDAGLEETLRQLEGYAHDDAPYETLRLSTACLDEAGREQVGVDVFELYWADLSRLRAGTFRILGELYQLVFHLPNLGRRAIDESRKRAASDPDCVPGPGAMRVLGWLQDAVTFLGAAVAPMLNLAAALTGVAVLTTLAPRGIHLAFWVVALPIVLASSLAVAGVLSAAKLGPRLVLGGALATAGIGLAASLALDVSRHLAWARDLRLVAIVAMGVAALVAAVPVVRYARRRHAVLALGVLSVALVIGAFARSAFGEWHHVPRPAATATIDTCTATPGEGGPCTERVAAWRQHHGTRRNGRGPWTPTHGHRVVLAAVSALEVVFAALNCTWALLLVAFAAFIAWSGVLSLLARRARRRPGAKGAAAERMRRALATARLTTSMSLLLFLLLTVPIGAALVTGVAGCVCLDLPYHHWIPWLELPRCSVTAGAFVRALPALAITPAAPIMAGVVVVAIVSFAVPLLPNALSELRVPRTRRFAGLFGLDVATQGVRFASLLVVLAIAVYFFGVAMTPIPVAKTPIPDAWATELEGLTGIVMRQIGTLLAGGAAGLLVFRGRLQSVTLGFRSTLDVALDVDNYLRDEPRSESVRGAIDARLAALLRHLRRAEYDHVVLVAHSQGTVIVADYLRFLHKLGRDDERPASLALFTMGSPLRQLYAARFPHLYEWAEGPTLHGPDPVAELGIDTWVNAFRGGDYVGRALFSPDPSGVVPPDDPEAVRDTSQRDPSPTRDVWVGLGAHTHYWDATAPVVARELDRLVRRV